MSIVDQGQMKFTSFIKVLFFNVSFSFNLSGCVFYKTVIIKKVLMIL